MRATRGLHRLTALQVKNAPASGPGSILHDGGGLSLRCRLWVFRYTSWVAGERKERDMSLGSADAITLKTTREIAAGHRELVTRGIDPIEQRDTERQEARARAAKARTFGDVLAQWTDTKLPERKGERNGKVRIPIHSGQAFRREAGHRSDLIPATIPI
jgi:hypothetical protein